MTGFSRLSSNKDTKLNTLNTTGMNKTSASQIPFKLIDWNPIGRTEHPGETGTALWQTAEFPGLRLRIVEYSAGYLADHWCRKGHIVHCLEGEVVSEMESGEEYLLTPGMTYVVSDDLSSHRSRAREGVKLLIIDGDFLK
jgi:hypothetical protein